MPKPVVSLPNSLRSFRLHEGLTVVGLARLSRVSERTLRDIEGGRGKPREVTLHRIVNALNAVPERRRKIDYALDDVFPPRRPRAV